MDVRDLNDNFKEASNFSGMIYVLKPCNILNHVDDYHIDTIYKMLLTFTMVYKETLNKKCEDLPFIAILITNLSRDYQASSDFINEFDSDKLIEMTREKLKERILEVQSPGMLKDEAVKLVDI